MSSSCLCFCPVECRIEQVYADRTLPVPWQLPGKLPKTRADIVISAAKRRRLGSHLHLHRSFFLFSFNLPFIHSRRHSRTVNRRRARRILWTDDESCAVSLSSRFYTLKLVYPYEGTGKTQIGVHSTWLVSLTSESFVPLLIPKLLLATLLHLYVILITLHKAHHIQCHSILT